MMKRAHLGTALLLAVLGVAVFAEKGRSAGIGDLGDELASNAIGGVTEVAAPAIVDESAKRAERARRNAKYANFPHTRLPWSAMKLYEKPDASSKVVGEVPPSVDLIVLEKAWWARVYCPSMDIEGWFDTMYLCQFKGQPVATINLNEVSQVEERLFQESLTGERISPPTSTPATPPASNPVSRTVTPTPVQVSSTDPAGTTPTISSNPTRPTARESFFARFFRSLRTMFAGLLDSFRTFFAGLGQGNGAKG